MNKTLTLYDLLPQESAFIKKLSCTGSIHRRLLDIGLTEQAKVTCVGESPAKDPKAFLIRGAVIAIRREDGLNILIEGAEHTYGNT
ncbi:MAG: FeoA family protein [Lachnospiraceae bacterium]|nr:FeoA family protein [Lachnospiraceae bacterium]